MKVKSCVSSQVWHHCCWEPQGSVQAAVVEPPAHPLQGAEVFGRGASEQPEGEPDTVQQTAQTHQHHQPSEYAQCGGEELCLQGPVVQMCIS